VTTLSNPIMPLIRYRIGDLVECSEGAYGARYVLHGRTRDAFNLATGKRVTTRQIDRCFVSFAGIAHYQLVQLGKGAWQLRFVPENSEPHPNELSKLQQRLSQLLECGGSLEMQQVDILMPESSGKFRLGYKTREVL
jgi:phenylacetate-coenzyme A ligase PaaK-like adenylate-forming protein